MCSTLSSVVTSLAEPFATFQTYGERGHSPLFLFCDHAFSYMPETYNGLRLGPGALSTHIASDIGAADLTYALADAFEARALLCGFSRLLIDPNRAAERDDSIPLVSDGVVIPGNRDLSYDERQKRISEFFEPYHQKLDAELDRHIALFANPLIVSVHSFTPVWEGKERPWEAGVLWKWDEPTALRLIAGLEAQGYAVGDNEPYSAKLYNYTIDRQVGPRNICHVTLELRQDLIDTAEGVARATDLLTGVLRGLIESR